MCLQGQAWEPLRPARATIPHVAKEKWRAQTVPGEDAGFLLRPPHPCPGGSQGCGRRFAGPPSTTSWGGKRLSLGSQGILGRTWAHLHRASVPRPPLPCSFLQLRCWLCHDGHSRGAEQDINLIKQCLDSHIFSAERDINLIKQ